jgi:hypothetical protein
VQLKKVKSFVIFFQFQEKMYLSLFAIYNIHRIQISLSQLQRVMNLIYIFKNKCGTFPLGNCPLKSKNESWSIKYIFHNYKYLRCLSQYKLVMYHVFIYNAF